METKWTKRYGEYAFVPDIETDKTLYEALAYAADKYSDRVAVEFVKRTITYRELIGFVDDYASAFAKIGVQKGDSITVACTGTPHQIIALYALNKLGASVSFLAGDTPQTEFVEASRIIKFKYAILTYDVYEHYRDVLPGTSVEKIIICRYDDFIDNKDRLYPIVFRTDRIERKKIDSLDLTGAISISFWNDLERSDMNIDSCGSPDDAAVFFLGGAAVDSVHIVNLSSRAMNEEAKLAGFLFGTNHLRILSFVRLAFSFGICFGLHTALMCGHSFLLHTQRPMQLPSIAFNNYRPDAVIGYPQILTDIIDNKKIKNKALSQIKVLYSSGSYMNGADHHRLTDFFKKKGLSPRILSLYGMTETASVCMFKPSDSRNDRVIGYPLPGIMMKIIDPETNSDQAEGTNGVIAINTPAAMTRYEDSPDDTSKVKRRFKDDRVWIMSGDIGMEDSEGLFYYSGTRKHYIRGGMPIYPQLIENEILTVRGVANCCAVVLERDGDTMIKVAIQPERDYLFDNDKLNALKDGIEKMCEMELAPPMHPDEYEFMAYLPMLSFGRADYNKIKEMFEEEENEQKDQNDTGDDPYIGDGL